MTKAEDIVKDEEYQYGFHDDIQPEFSTGRGLTEEVVRRISAEKHTDILHLSLYLLL